MTIDEAIQHCEEVARDKEIDIENQDRRFPNNIEECERCAEEHRQLAEWLKELKQLKEQTRWIPVSERLPEKSGEYLLCGKIGGHEEYNYCFIGEYTPYETFGFTHDYYDTESFSPIDSEIIEYHSVIAWMPLPKPYKAESEVQDADSN